MTSRVVWRVGTSSITILGATLIAFLFMRVIPGDPARLVLGNLASPAAVRALRHQMGLDQPLYVQYYRYISGFLRGDWGFSFSNGESVRSLIGARLPASLELGFYAFILAFSMALVLALAITYRPRPYLDRFVRGVSYFALGTPAFWLGLILLVIFSAHFKILPGPEGRLAPGESPPASITHFYTVDAILHGQFALAWQAFEHLILPAFTLAFASFGFLVRLLRANLLDVSHEQFILAARAKGHRRAGAFVRHALPNAFLPTLTAAGLVFAELLAGSVLVEKVYDWPGVGALVVDSVTNQDFAVVQTFILLSAFLYVIVNLGVDLLYGVIDPRTRVLAVGSA